MESPGAFSCIRVATNSCILFLSRNQLRKRSGLLWETELRGSDAGMAFCSVSGAFECCSWLNVCWRSFHCLLWRYRVLWIRAEALSCWSIDGIKALFRDASPSANSTDFRKPLYVNFREFMTIFKGILLQVRKENGKFLERFAHICCFNRLVHCSIWFEVGGMKRKCGHPLKLCVFPRGI